ncbi:hypothetical protein C8J57DRAFT_1509745 [Mycena rebaudengoi]|nr:hypothetical protein C8J57DRAFT_1509745 [Mycena rebaudengoi]
MASPARGIGLTPPVTASKRKYLEAIAQLGEPVIPVPKNLKRAKRDALEQVGAGRPQDRGTIIRCATPYLDIGLVLHYESQARWVPPSPTDPTLSKDIGESKSDQAAQSGTGGGEEDIADNTLKRLVKGTLKLTYHKWPARFYADDSYKASDPRKGLSFAATSFCGPAYLDGAQLCAQRCHKSQACQQRTPGRRLSSPEMIVYACAQERLQHPSHYPRVRVPTTRQMMMTATPTTKRSRPSASLVVVELSINVLAIHNSRLLYYALQWNYYAFSLGGLVALKLECSFVSLCRLLSVLDPTSHTLWCSTSGKVASFSLEISVESEAAQADVARLSRQMMRLLRKIVPDADFHDWLVPEFSTTTLTDTKFSCLLALSGSFSSLSPTAPQTRSGGDAHYTFGASCGIPRVTLDGERADWEILFARLDCLKTRCKDFGLPAVAWYHLLHPVLARFIGAFDDLEGVENREFWGGVVVGKAESNGGGGGSKNAGKLSGWITAFCAFSAEGTWLGPELNTSATADALETLTAAQFWSMYTRLAPAPEKSNPKPKSKAAKAKAKKAVQLDLDVDPAALPAPTIVIALEDVPLSYASAELELSFKTKAKVSGGASAGVNLSATERNDTVRPVVAWWIYERGGTSARTNGNRRPKVRQDAKDTKDKEEDSEEHIPVVPAPCVHFDLGLGLDRELDGALAGTVGGGLDVGLQTTTSPGAGAGVGSADTHEPEPESVSTPAVVPVQQSDLWSLDLDTPVIPEPPAQPPVLTSFFANSNPDAAGLGAGRGSDTDTGGWNTVSWSTSAPASKAGFELGFGFESGFGFGTAPAAVPDPEPVMEQAFVASGGQDTPASASAPADSESLVEVALEPDVEPTGTGNGGEAEVKPGKEQMQEQEQQLETQTETPALSPPAPEDPELDGAAAAWTPAAPAGNGEDADSEDAADGDDALTPVQVSAATKADGKNSAGVGELVVPILCSTLTSDVPRSHCLTAARNSAIEFYSGIHLNAAYNQVKSSFQTSAVPTSAMKFLATATFLLLLLTSTSTSATAAKSDKLSRLVKRETNADRFRRGLGPLPPTKRNPNFALQPRASMLPCVRLLNNLGSIQITNLSSGRVIGYIGSRFNGQGAYTITPALSSALHVLVPPGVPFGGPIGLLAVNTPDSRHPFFGAVGDPEDFVLGAAVPSAAILAGTTSRMPPPSPQSPFL